MPELPGTLAYFDQPACPATIEVVAYDPRRRVTRAVIVLLQFWGLAALAVLIPVLHFLLVPALFLLGPFLAYRRLHEAATVNRIRGTCPACGKLIDHAAKEPWKPLLRLDCEHCHRRIVLESSIP